MVFCCSSQLLASSVRRPGVLLDTPHCVISTPIKQAPLALYVKRAKMERTCKDSKIKSGWKVPQRHHTRLNNDISTLGNTWRSDTVSCLGSSGSAWLPGGRRTPESPSACSITGPGATVLLGGVRAPQYDYKTVLTSWTPQRSLGCPRACRPPLGSFRGAPHGLVFAFRSKLGAVGRSTSGLLPAGGQAGDC